MPMVAWYVLSNVSYMNLQAVQCMFLELHEENEMWQTAL